ncbi:unnamed protein product [Symbiodinium necroappetens]|uniref:Uncharacterized protein n=1 Tax=Symbiodinium necroappetens TaxID=1628268 RepID=A0A812T6M8_9DINO|nr:unnamed protein product [Symbiodinium necroappetens]
MRSPTRPGSCWATGRGLASALPKASRRSTWSACAKLLWTSKRVQARRQAPWSCRSPVPSSCRCTPLSSPPW